jgi:uncharacterized membrane protein YqjE
MYQNLEKAFGSIFKLAIVGFITMWLVGLGLMGWFVYAAIHFILKHWN